MSFANENMEVENIPKTRKIIKRDGRREDVSFDKVLNRIRHLCGIAVGGHGAGPSASGESSPARGSGVLEKNVFAPLWNVRYDEIAQEVVKSIHDGINTSELDEYAASFTYPRVMEHTEYGILASRIAISNYHKNTIHHLYTHFSRIEPELTMTKLEQNLTYYTYRALYENMNEKTGVQAPLIAPDIFLFVSHFRNEIEDMVDYFADYSYDYPGFKLLEETYLMRCTLYNAEGKLVRVHVERPQHLIMREALGIHLSGRYRNFNKARCDDMAVIGETQEILERYILDKNWDKLKNQAMKNKVDWKDVLHTLSMQVVDADELVALSLADTVEKMMALDIKSDFLTVFKSIQRHTRSWADLVGVQSEYALGLQNLLANEELLKKRWEEIRNTYELRKEKYFTHATPTLYAISTLVPQCSSCYLTTPPQDSMQGISKAWHWYSEIQKWAGGLGSHYHHIRAEGSYIGGTNGHSNGLPPLLKVVDSISVYVDQGGNKRPGSHAVYLEPWHGDIMKVIWLKDKLGNDAERARNLHYGLWNCDEFMRTVKQETQIQDRTGEKVKLWHLMCPNEARNLSGVYDKVPCVKYITDEELFAAGSEGDLMRQKFPFTYLYRSYVRADRYLAKVSASEIWSTLLKIQMGNGEPYIACKDAGNRKSNQKNIGTVRSTNLCTEIFEVSNDQETAVCNLASINLRAFVVGGGAAVGFNGHEFNPFADGFNVDLLNILNRAGSSPKIVHYDWLLLERIVRTAIRNLNKIINLNFYPISPTKRSNIRHRPVGLGIQDLAGLFTSLRLSFDSEEAMRVNFYIFEFIYFVALDESCKLARMEGAYETFVGSPASLGKLQFDLWEEEQQALGRSALRYPLACRWGDLKADIMKYGLRNSLLIALMPTGSTSTIMGCTPCFEPHNSMIYKRKNRAGEYSIVNRSLIMDLMELGLWNKKIRDEILNDRRGSVAEISSIPLKVREIYKTCWDVDPMHQVEMAIIRGPFIDQSQSMSLFIAKPTIGLLNKVHFYSWSRGLKTLVYYSRRLASADAQKIQVENTQKEKEQTTTPAPAQPVVRIVEGEACFGPDCKSCSS